VTLNTQVSLLAAFAGLALTIACSSESAGPGPLPSCGAHGTQLSLAVAQYTSINPASDSGCVTFAANASPDTAEYLVLPWSTGGTPATSTSFILQSATPVAATIAPEFVSGRISPSGSTTGPRGPNAVAFDHFLRESARARRYALPTRSITAASVPAPPAPSPAGPPTVGSSRTFKVCSNAKCSTFANVGAVARAVGTHIAIYVDTLAPSPIDSATLRGLQQVFDSRLYPLDTATFGNVSDIDGNSVVIVLMTGTVNHLVSKAQCSGGYVAGFFFTGDLDPAFASQFNNGEIFYSVVPDPNGTLSCAHTNADVVSLTPVIFTHEFQHMINFVQHVLVRSANSEEGWLDEGLSKYAEELAGRSYLPDSQQAFSRYAFNSVSDAYDYLVAPGSSPLLIPVDSGSLAEVGASWLFTRYIVDQFGGDVGGPIGAELPVRRRERYRQDGPALRHHREQLGIRQLGLGSAWLYGTCGASLHHVALPHHVRVAPRPGLDRFRSSLSPVAAGAGGERGQRQRDAVVRIWCVYACGAETGRSGLHAAIQRSGRSLRVGGGVAAPKRSADSLRACRGRRTCEAAPLQ